jgi:biotin transporter BioY
MNNVSLLRIALIGLIALAVIDLVGILYLASANPARSIPDILVGSLTLIVGAIVGILVPSKGA